MKYVYIFEIAEMMETENKKNISRRDFMTAAWGIVTALPFFYAAYRFISPGAAHFRPASERNNTNSDLTNGIALNNIPEDSARIVNIEDEQLLLIRRKGNDVSALSAVCTHLDCTLGYRKEQNDIHCGCHGGRFDTNGKVLEGPPKKPLQKYEVKIENGKIIVKLPS